STYAHVEAYAVGKTVGSEHVLHELVGGVGIEAAAIHRAFDLVRAEAGRFADERTTLGERDLVEAGETRSLRHDEMNPFLRDGSTPKGVEGKIERAHAVSFGRADELYGGRALAQPHTDVTAACTRRQERRAFFFGDSRELGERRRHDRQIDR